MAAAGFTDSSKQLAPKGKPELLQLRPGTRRSRTAVAPAGQLPVWYHRGRREWVTSFSPPPGFDGRESGRYGDSDYHRALSARELAVQEQGLAAGMANITAQDAANRDAWFGFPPDPVVRCAK